MIALFLDNPLDDDELVEVQIAVGEPVEQARIPWLLSVDTLESSTPSPDQVLPHLTRLGVQEQQGRRVLLIAPSQTSWYTSLAEAIRTLTGSYPLLVQTEDRRTDTDQPKGLRIVDMEAYLLDEDARGSPPWEGGGLLPEDL